jgi:uncharacterized membrane protein
MPTLDENLDRLDQRPSARDGAIRVHVVNVNIPFFQMVWLLIKLAIAAIPAAFIFGLFVALLTAVFGGLLTGYFGGLFNGWHWI